MKKSLLFVSAGLLALSLSAPASACVDGDMCVDSIVKFAVGVSSDFGGFGGGMFRGSEGAIDVSKVGYSFTEVVMNVAGSPCDVDCQDADFTATGAAGERVDVSGWAKGTTSGETTSVINGGGSFANVIFTLGKTGIVAPAP
jgi:hypothetical protein